MAFTLKKDKLGDSSSEKYKRQKGMLFMLVVLILLILVVNIVLAIWDRTNIEIVQLKQAVMQDSIITLDNLEQATMTRSDYAKKGLYTLSDGSQRRAIVLWEDRTKLVNTFASYYLRQGTSIYWDSLSNETPKQYSYLYKMDGELAEIAIPAEQFGEILVPGDHINVRASYVEQIYTLPTLDEYSMQQQTGVQAQTTIQRQIKLFNNTSVLDILNSNGESIFDIYYDFLSLPKAKQQELLDNEDFKARVTASKVLANLTPEEADKYMSIQNNGPAYMLTLLPRTSSNPITEALNELLVGFSR